MTTLAQNASDTDTVIVVTPGSEQENGFHFRVDDEIVTFLGYDRDSTADILDYLGGDRTRWRVRRGEEGTTAAAHLSGATLYAVVPAWSTSADLTDPDPFAPNAAPPTLAEVLAEGNDTAGLPIQTGAVEADYASIQPVANGGAAASEAFASTVEHSARIGPNVGASWAGFGVQIDGQDMPFGQTLVGNPDLGVAVFGTPGAAELVITEDASGAAGTYSGSIVVPGGATITAIGVTPIADWSSNIAVTIQIGVDGELGRYLEDGPGGFTLGTTSWDTGDGLGSFSNSGVGWYSDTDNEILVTVTVNDTNPPGTGVLRVLVTWSLPPSSAATFEAAP